jgi:hypothetical protein
MPVTAQVWHCPAHAPLQQTPSTQLLLVHSEPATQACPLLFLGSEQLPALSHRLVALQACPTLRALPWQSSWPPQLPATQRCELTLAGKSRQVVSAGQSMIPQASSSCRLVQAVPEAAQMRQGPLQAAVQQMRSPPAVA